MDENGNISDLKFRDDRYFSSGVDAITSMLQCFDSNVTVTRIYDMEQRMYKIEYGADTIVTSILEDMSENLASLP